MGGVGGIGIFGIGLVDWWGKLKENGCLEIFGSYKKICKICLFAFELA